MKPRNHRFLAFMAFALFLGWLTPWVLNLVNAKADYYTSWSFHECYVKTLDARHCSDVEIKPSGFMGYDYYPPVTHLLARLIPLPAKQSLQLLAVALFLGLFVLMAAGTNSFAAGAAFLIVSPQLWSTSIKGGTVPFFLFLFWLLAAIFWWKKMGWKAKAALFVTAAFTHVYGGWFFMVFVLVLEALPRDAALASGLVASVLMGILLDITFLYQEYRGWMLVMLFSCVVFGEAIAKIDAYEFVYERMGAERVWAKMKKLIGR
jgi:hypothetical protein